MNKSRLLGAVCACLIGLSFNANAVVQNTLNGVDYEWMELTETQGLSRDQVELRLVDPNDVLYGYEYASRSLVEDLLLSYSSWDGLSGLHGDSGVVNGIDMYLDDFGRTGGWAQYANAGDIFTTVDGYAFAIYGGSWNYGHYGTTDECGTNMSCYTYIQVEYNEAGAATMAYQGAELGWQSASTNPYTLPSDYNDSKVGSYLVSSTTVPLPAAVWLFGSGLLGLIGIARRKKTT